EAPRVLLVADAAVEDRLRAAVPELNGNLQRWSGAPSNLRTGAGLAELMATKPDVVAFGPDLPTADVFELAAALDRQHPEIEILLMADPSPRLWERAARTGIREVVSSSADDEKLRVAVQRTLATITERRGHHRSLSPPEAAALPAVVVVRSPKGGSGKTMVASNIA